MEHQANYTLVWKNLILWKMWNQQTKRTTLFGEFPWINMAFDWNNTKILRVLPTAHCHFVLKPADAVNSCCKTQWHTGCPSVMIADSGKVRITSQWRLRTWLRGPLGRAASISWTRQHCCTWSCTASPGPYTSQSASLQLIETWLTEQLFSSMEVQTHWQWTCRYKMSIPSLAIINCDRRKTIARRSTIDERRLITEASPWANTLTTVRYV